MTFLGATIGIPMGISYPFPIMTKLSIISGLIVSIIFIYFGFKNHKKYIGQVLALLGIVIWSFIGVIGLGTGT